MALTEKIASAAAAFRQMSLGVQIALLLGLAMAPIGLLGVLQAVSAAQETRALEGRALVALAERSASEERALLSTAFGALDGLAAARAQTAEDCGAMFEIVIRDVPHSVLAGHVDPGGLLRCRSDAGAQMLVTSSPALAVQLADPKRRIWPRDAGAASGRPVLVASVPAFDASGAPDGVFFMSVDRDAIARMVQEHAMGARYRTMLVDAEGRALLKDPEAGWRPSAPISPADVRAGGGPDAVSMVAAASRDGGERLYAVAPVIEGLAYEIATWSESDSDFAASRQIARAMAFPMLMWAMALIIAYLAMDRLVVRDIRRMRADIRAFARADRSRPADSYRDAAGEIAEVGRAFSAMTRIIAREEAAQSRLLAEKSGLLKELHHRVRNNLQLIVSIVNMQLRESGAAAQTAALADLQGRVMTIAAVHRALFEAEELSAVEASSMLREVVAGLAPESDDLALDASLQTIHLTPDAALPLALIAGEAVLGALDRGGVAAGLVAPGGAAPVMRMALRRLAAEDCTCGAADGDGCVVLEIDAPAPALAPGGAAARPLGPRLMHALATQLSGELTIDEIDGRRRLRLCMKNVETIPTGTADVEDPIQETRE